MWLRYRPRAGWGGVRPPDQSEPAAVGGATRLPARRGAPGRGRAAVRLHPKGQRSCVEIRANRAVKQDHNELLVRNPRTADAQQRCSSDGRHYARSIGIGVAVGARRALCCSWLLLPGRCSVRPPPCAGLVHHWHAAGRPLARRSQVDVGPSSACHGMVRALDTAQLVRETGRPPPRDAVLVEPSPGAVRSLPLGATRRSPPTSGPWRSSGRPGTGTARG